MLESPSHFFLELERVAGAARLAVAGPCAERVARREAAEAHRAEAARAAAAYVSGAYAVVVIEPEKTLKAAGRLTIRPAPPDAATRDRDAFREGLVPFLRALFAGRTRVVLATALGVRVSDPSPSNSRPTEARIRECVDDLRARLAAEVGSERPLPLETLFAWRCSAARVAEFARVEIKLAERAPSLEESAAAVAGGAVDIAARIAAAAGGASARLRRAAEWAPDFADDGRLFATAAALGGGGRALVVGGDSDASRRARAAGLDYVYVGDLVSPGTSVLAALIQNPTAPAAAIAAEDFPY